MPPIAQLVLIKKLIGVFRRYCVVAIRCEGFSYMFTEVHPQIPELHSTKPRRLHTWNVRYVYLSFTWPCTIKMYSIAQMETDEENAQSMLETKSTAVNTQWFSPLQHHLQSGTQTPSRCFCWCWTSVTAVMNAEYLTCHQSRHNSYTHLQSPTGVISTHTLSNTETHIYKHTPIKQWVNIKDYVLNSSEWTHTGITKKKSFFLIKRWIQP